MSRIFISYASKDQETADRVVQGLEQSGLRCWISSRDIRPGADYQVCIVKALEQADIVLLLLSAAANLSVEVPKEMSLAGSKRKQVIPARIESVEPAGALAYQASHAHRVDLFPGFDRKLGELSVLLGEQLQMGAEVKLRVNNAAATRSTRRWVLVAGGGAIVLASAAIMLKFAAPHAGGAAVPEAAAQDTAPPPASPPPQMAPAPPANLLSAQTAVPQTPPPGPAAGSREARVSAFTSHYYASMSASPDAALAFLSSAAADYVRFYGQRVTRERFVSSEQTYLERWPVRRFVLRPETVAVTCAYPSAECSVTGTVDYQLGSSARSAAAAGAEKFTLRVEVLGDDVKILDVSSAAITHQNDTAPR